MEGEFDDGFLDFGSPGVGDFDGDEVGVGEVAVVVGFFLGALDDGDVFVVVPAAGEFWDFGGDGLIGAAVGVPFGELALDFVGAGTFDAAEAVEIFDFGDGGFESFAGVEDVEVDVGFEAHVALLHDALGDAQVAADAAEFFAKEAGFLGGVEVGLSDDFKQGGAGAVEVDLREAGVAFVEEFAGVFLEVGAADADGFETTVGEGQFDGAFAAEGEVVLGNLVIFGEIGVVIGFAIPLGEGGDAAIEGEADHHGHFDGAFVDDGKYAGEAEDDGIDEGVGGGVGVVGV